MKKTSPLTFYRVRPRSRKLSQANQRPPRPGKPAVFPSAYAKLFFAALTLVVLYFFYIIIKPYLVQIFLAFVLFFTTRPLYRGLTVLMRGQRALAAFCTCVVLSLLITLSLWTLANIMAKQALELYSSVSAGLKSDQVWPQISAKWDLVRDSLENLGLAVPEQADLEDVLQTVLSQVSLFIYDNAINLARRFISYFLNLLLVLFLTFFMFLQGDAFIGEIKKLSPLDEVHNQEILQVTEATIKVTIRTTLIVALIQGILGGLGFFLFQVSEPVFWGAMMGVASVLPVVGPVIIWLPGVIYLYFRGDLGLALGLFLWGSLIISMVDNLLRPILIKGVQSTSTVLIFLSILGGISYFGMVGFILGPLILSFLLSLLRIYQKAALEIFPRDATPVRIPESQEK
ncbi:MAG: AI-2E family transporter [Desulfobacca sp.]|nr:AI-2E family transporter [Desulfobacca sp.]